MFDILYIRVRMNLVEAPLKLGMLQNNLLNFNSAAQVHNSALWPAVLISKVSLGNCVMLVFSSGILVFFKFWRWRRHIPPKRQLTLIELQDRTLHNYHCENLEWYTPISAGCSAVPLYWARSETLFSLSKCWYWDTVSFRIVVMLI
jgi:hypothetical protein